MDIVLSLLGLDLFTDATDPPTATTAITTTIITAATKFMVVTMPPKFRLGLVGFRVRPNLTPGPDLTPNSPLDWVH